MMIMTFPSFLFVAIIAAVLLLHTIEAARGTTATRNFFSLKAFHNNRRQQQQQKTRLTFPYSSFSTTTSNNPCCTNNIVGGHLALIKKKKKGRRSKQQQQQQQEFEETTNETTIIQTEAAKLARLFDQVLLVDDDGSTGNDVLHVGRLLLACEQLAEANRNVGFTQSAYDIMGNIKKIKSVYDQYPNKSQRDSISVLIQYELDLGIHKDPTKYLTKNSAAMGFLWLARNINYQYDMFSQMIFESDAEPYDAAITAYERALKPHLSKPLQRVGQAALGTLKPITKETIMSRIGGFDINNNSSAGYSGGTSTNSNSDNNNNNKSYYGLREEDATIRDMKLVLQTWQPMITKCQQVFIDLDLGQHDI